MSLGSCWQCKSADKCEICHNENALLANGACFPCSKVIRNCIECKEISTSEIICVKCRSGYGLISGKCTSCPLGCSDCELRNSTIICTKCAYFGYWTGYSFIDSNGICRYCQNGCKRCSFDENNKNTCHECISSRTYAFKDRCYPCKIGCSNCNNLTTCNSCLSGRYLRGNNCEKCSIPECKKCQISRRCKRCSPHTFLSRDKLKCYSTNILN